MINKIIKFFILFLISFNIYAGGDDRDDAYYANLDEELAAFEAQVAAEVVSQEMMAEIEAEMARQAALDAFQAKLAADKAAAAASTAAYQDQLLDAEFAALEAQIAAELASQEMMAEIEREMALAAFLQKLADDKAAAAASTEAYQASLADEEVIGVIEEVIVTEAAHEACKVTLNLTESNIALFKSALADGSLFSVGPQSSNGTQFGPSRWDTYAKCVSNYVNPF
jgi:colicin import membrane protein